MSTNHIDRDKKHQQQLGVREDRLIGIMGLIPSTFQVKVNFEKKWGVIDDVYMVSIKLHLCEK